MKLKQMGLIVLLCVGLIPALQAQSYEQMWKNMENTEKKSLPKTAIEQLGGILKKAEKEKNSPQMFRAYIRRMQHRIGLNPDSFYVELKGLEQWAEQAEKPADRAILHSIIADIYADYAGSNRWQLKQHKDIAGQEPAEDMREWTANMFIGKVVENIKQALSDTNLLLSTSTDAYRPFAQQGETSRYFRHDLYHLLAARAIQSLEQVEDLEKGRESGQEGSAIRQHIDSIYGQMCSTYLAAGLKEAYVLVSLGYLEWKYDADEGYIPLRGKNGGTVITGEAYLQALNELRSRYADDPISTEVYIVQANYLEGEGKQTEALRLCEEVIDRFPSHPRINAVKRIKEHILLPRLNVNMPSPVYPGQEMKLNVSHVNLDGFTVRLYRGKALVKEQHYALTRPADYQSADTTYTLPVPDLGRYQVEVIADDRRVKKDEREELNVTDFKLVSVLQPDDRYKIMTLDARTGHPIPNAKVLLYSDRNTLEKELTTNENGEAYTAHSQRYIYAKATKGADTAMPQTLLHGYWANDDNGRNNVRRERVALLTDRSLYRPGQTIYVKGIASVQMGDSANVLANKNYMLKLFDVNRQEVARAAVCTNEFGSFTAEFALPTAVLNGSFTVQAGDFETYIRVEEYKRPTFDITFEKLQDSYKLGNEVQLKGNVRSFSGANLADVSVTYTVKRSSYSFRMLRESKQIASGKVVADADGVFSLPIRLDEPKNATGDEQVFYRYTIEATVTNAAGETQSSTQRIAAGRRSLVLNAEVADRLLKDEPLHLIYKVTNLNDEAVSVKGTYALYPVQDENATQPQGKAVATGSFTSNEEVTADWRQLPSGRYLLKAVVQDTQGQEVTYQTTTVLFSMTDRRPPVDTKVWLYQVNVDFDATHPAVFTFGTSEKDAYVLMDIRYPGRKFESRVIHLSDSIARFEYPYREEYGDGIFINFLFVRDGKVYQTPVSLSKRMPERELTLKWDVFRDKLLPGQQEEWKLTVRTPDGKAADAEMLATMYDASLDKIWKRSTNFRLSYTRTVPAFSWLISSQRDIWINAVGNGRDFKVPSLAYDRLDVRLSSGMNMVGRERLLFRGSRSIYMAEAIAENMVFDEAAMPTKAYAESKVVGNAREEGTDDTAPTENLRTNLAETAFFYPQLRTNERGEVSLAFTVPESLTRWNFRGYAHTKGMLTGTLEGSTVTAKEFMLTPHLPRFVRVGDHTSVAASIANATARTQSGKVTLTLFDPMTNKTVHTEKQAFRVEAGKTIGVNFLFTVDDTYRLLGCRLMAESDQFSDGEQQLLPVLANKQHLVETVAMPIRGGQSRTFSLESLFNGRSHTATGRRLTVEFTGNPAWYAVQALPALNQSTGQDAITWATVYYANTLAAHILNSQPRIKAVFENWRLQGGTKESFMSNLEKNRELKNIILAESPWVLEAQTEAQQRARIATLFDLNHVRNNHLSALTRLEELQLPEGAWPWYKGMGGSRYVTSYITELLARLAQLTGEQSTGKVLTLRNRSLAYLHREAVEEYQEILKAEKRGMKHTGLSSAALDYLYLVALTGDEVPASAKPAYTYYINKVKELLTSADMEAKATAAIVLHKAGRQEEAQSFIASLKEHLTQTDEQGMFFDFNENPYIWGGMQLPAHVRVMEALNTIGKNSDTVEEMKLWLLKQKQTQQWDSPVATADAVYALLMNGSDLLANPGDVRILIADEVMETYSPSKTIVPELGYIKRTYTQHDVLDARSIEVEKRNSGIAWGAVYAEYDTPLGDVKQHGGELNVQKQLYVERSVNNAPQLQPVTESTPLEMGDKVVSRLTIRLDRPMDFVQLIDGRGACFEPLTNLSGYHWSNGAGHYVDIKDASTRFFFDHLGKGVYVLEHTCRVSRAGTYEAGLATMQCAYAPEYASHSASLNVRVKGE